MEMFFQNLALTCFNNKENNQYIRKLKSLRKTGYQEFIGWKETRNGKIIDYNKYGKYFTLETLK